MYHQSNTLLTFFYLCYKNRLTMVLKTAPDQWSTHLVVLILFYLFGIMNAIDPSTTTGCYIHTAMKHRAEKEGCRPMEFYVRGCFGRCDTNEVGMLKQVKLHHKTQEGGSGARVVSHTTSSSGVRPLKVKQN